MSEFEWTLIDTETTGLVAPIYVVELAAQRMRGWQPIGPSFHVFLNHNVDIPSGAESVHGYTRSFLALKGTDPRSAHHNFSAYAEHTPLVSYNLQYDYDKVLLPEWNRLQFSPISKRGFCALKLTRKLTNSSPTENYKLQTLRKFYRLPDSRAHSALGDVQTVIDLFRLVLRPIAEKKGLNSYGELENYAKGDLYPE
jgi:DNA polymerase III epsilon subunit-like protein